MGRWELFAHDADVGVRDVGPTRAAAFEQSAIALMHAIGAGAGVAPRQSLTIACAAPDDETLLVDWLNAVIFAMATRSMLFSRFRVQIEDGPSSTLCRDRTSGFWNTRARSASRYSISAS